MPIVLSVVANRPVGSTEPPLARYRREGERSLVPQDRVSISAEARQRYAAGGRLTEEQQRELLELRRRDGHVRAHEAAHQAAAGGLAGPARFEYRVGPDGRSYAVGGEVPLHAPPGRTPDETISIARRVKAAALAPSDPSPADLAAASAATSIELRALAQKRRLTDGAARGASSGPAARIAAYVANSGEHSARFEAARLKAAREYFGLSAEQAGVLWVA